MLEAQDHVHVLIPGGLLASTFLNNMQAPVEFDWGQGHPALRVDSGGHCENMGPAEPVVVGDLGGDPITADIVYNRTSG